MEILPKNIGSLAGKQLGTLVDNQSLNKVTEELGAFMSIIKVVFGMKTGGIVVYLIHCFYNEHLLCIKHCCSYYYGYSDEEGYKFQPSWS